MVFVPISLISPWNLQIFLKKFIIFSVEIKQRNTEEIKIPRILIQIGPKVQMNLFGVFWRKKLTRNVGEAKTEQRLIYSTESKMKEFHKHIVESLLEGVKSKVKWIGENGVYFFI